MAIRLVCSFGVLLLASGQAMGDLVFYDFALDSSPGWTTQGQWAFGMPVGGGSHNHDPVSGHTGSNVYGYNLAGDYPNNMIAMNLTTGAMDLSGITNVHLTYWRWLGVESNAYDHATVQVSTNGADFTTIWQNPPSTLDDGTWVYQDLDISAFDNQPVVYVRWVMGPTDATQTYCGWNIDDVQLTGVPEPGAFLLTLFAAALVGRRRLR